MEERHSACLGERFKAFDSADREETKPRKKHKRRRMKPKRNHFVKDLNRRKTQSIKTMFHNITP
ncbi:hypothetical protein J6590_055218 [Homalodisca vitripennis]|nr:hypothetical protein J6590_055218 [Homalodisca vitripennis]